MVVFKSKEVMRNVDFILKCIFGLLNFVYFVVLLFIMFCVILYVCGLDVFEN